MFHLEKQTKTILGLIFYKQLVVSRSERRNQSAEILKPIFGAMDPAEIVNSQ